MTAGLGSVGKKTVLLRPGDKVDVGSFDACRFVEKTVAAVDTETNTITLTDGTTYNAQENPRVQIIVPQS